MAPGRCACPAPPYPGERDSSPDGGAGPCRASHCAPRRSREVASAHRCVETAAGSRAAARRLARAAGAGRAAAGGPSGRMPGHSSSSRAAVSVSGSTYGPRSTSCCGGLTLWLAGWAGDASHQAARSEGGYQHALTEVTGFDPVACRFTGTGWEQGQSQQRRTQTGRCDTPAAFRLLLVRHGSPAGQGIVRAPIVHELPGPERPALEAPQRASCTCISTAPARAGRRDSAQSRTARRISARHVIPSGAETSINATFLRDRADRRVIMVASPGGPATGRESMPRG